MMTTAVSAKHPMLQVLFPSHPKYTQPLNVFSIGTDKVSLVVFGGALPKIFIKEDLLLKSFSAFFTPTIQHCSDRFFQRVESVVIAFLVTKGQGPSHEISSIEDKFLELIDGQSNVFRIDSYSIEHIPKEALDGRWSFSAQRKHPTNQEKSMGTLFNMLLNDKGSFLAARIVLPPQEQYKPAIKRRLWMHLFEKTTHGLKTLIDANVDEIPIETLEHICSEFGNFFFQAANHADYKVKAGKIARIYETEPEFMLSKSSQEIAAGWGLELKKKSNGLSKSILSFTQSF